MESLYRKYRPQTFESMVGQRHIVSTLQNALADGRMAHAYLFTGPRGTGKTTTARLLAKALLCEAGGGNATAHPDGTCEQCQEIARGTHPDVYELDAASRTGVDNVRDEIINRVAFAPTQGRYKVYVIDEVHMLTTAAFNALLKTLEEPPSHVVFVLCTTDPQKIPETVLSRCQRLEFHRISDDDIAERLKFVCTSEGFDYDDEALALVARHARGGLRDALSTLETLSVHGRGSVHAQDARELLGEVADDTLSGMAALVAARDVAGCFARVAEMSSRGMDIEQYVRDFTRHMRNVYVASVAGAGAFKDAGQAGEFVEQATAFGGSDRLAHILDILGGLEDALRTSTDQRLDFEVALTRMARPKADLSLEALAARVEALEAELAAVRAGGAGAGASVAGGAGGIGLAGGAAGVAGGAGGAGFAGAAAPSAGMAAGAGGAACSAGAAGALGGGRMQPAGMPGGAGSAPAAAAAAPANAPAPAAGALPSFARMPQAGASAQAAPAGSSLPTFAQMPQESATADQITSGSATPAGQQAVSTPMSQAAASVQVAPAGGSLPTFVQMPRASAAAGQAVPTPSGQQAASAPMSQAGAPAGSPLPAFAQMHQVGASSGQAVSASVTSTGQQTVSAHMPQAQLAPAGGSLPTFARMPQAGAPAAQNAAAPVAPAGRQAAPAGAAQTSQRPAAAPAAGALGGPHVPDARWPQICQQAGAIFMPVTALLNKAIGYFAPDGTLVVENRGSDFVAKQLQRDNPMRALKQAAEQVMGQSVPIRVVGAGATASARPSASVSQAAPVARPGFGASSAQAVAAPRFSGGASQTSRGSVSNVPMDGGCPAFGSSAQPASSAAAPRDAALPAFARMPQSPASTPQAAPASNPAASAQAGSVNPLPAFARMPQAGAPAVPAAPADEAPAFEFVPDDMYDGYQDASADVPADGYDAPWDDPAPAAPASAAQPTQPASAASQPARFAAPAASPAASPSAVPAQPTRFAAPASPATGSSAAPAQPARFAAASAMPGQPAPASAATPPAASAQPARFSAPAARPQSAQRPAAPQPPAAASGAGAPQSGEDPTAWLTQLLEAGFGGPVKITRE